MQRIFPFYQDPSHGWVKVKRALLMKVGVAHAISTCSFERKNDVYLEEDSDAPRFIEAYKTMFGVEPKFKSLHTNKSSKICSYNQFNLRPYERYER